ncbi:MAG TPA: TMEM175 family protein [Bacteroidia bacterium]|nr:TMEM175 family protein [Bacteroidia bacterium]
MSFYHSIAGQKIPRIEELSDGVFSIAMTLLVFDLKDPIGAAMKSDTEMMVALAAILPKLLAYFLSFITLGIFWTSYSTQFNYIKKYDHNLNWLSLFFLLFVSILPFTTGILSNHIHNKVSIGLYWFNIFALGIMLLVHWRYAYKNHYMSLPDSEILRINMAINNRILIAQSLYAGGAMLCFISTYLSIIAIILIQLNYALSIFEGRKIKKLDKEIE